MRILIAGGGTGGHVYPGIAVAEEFIRQDPASEIIFVGTNRGIETKIVPQEGYELKIIPAAGIVNKGIAGKIVSGIKMISGFVKSFSLLKKSAPDIVLGVGGYASVPVLSAAAILKIPTVIMEQNLMPGLANRILSRLADRVVVTFEGSRDFFKREVDVLGNPVRRKILECSSQPHEILVIFVFGGSQGAHAINRAVVDALDYLKEKKGMIRFIHQTGEKDREWVIKSYQEAGIEAQVTAYVYAMEEVYSQADLVISRAGATTIAEITASRRPAILIPYPHAAHDHQRKNAEYLESIGTAEVIAEQDLTGKKLGDKITFFLYNRERLKEMSEKSAGLSRRNAAEDIVKLCRELIK